MQVADTASASRDNRHFSEATCATAIRRYVAGRMSDIGAMLSRSAVPRDNDYNRNSSRPQVALPYQATGDGQQRQTRPTSHNCFLPLLSLISPNNTPYRHPLSSDKISNKFARLCHTSEVIIVHCNSPLLADYVDIPIQVTVCMGIRLPPPKKNLWTQMHSLAPIPPAADFILSQYIHLSNISLS